MNDSVFPYEPSARKGRVLTALAVVVVVSISFFAYSYWDLRSQFVHVNYQLETTNRVIQLLQEEMRLLAVSNRSGFLSVSQVFSLVKDSVVLIKTKVRVLGKLQDYAQGSGFVIDGAGRIITNNHVIEGADEIDVILTSGNSAKATIIGTDVYSDIAIIKVYLPAETFYPVVLGNSSRLIVGEPVIAVGNPYGLSGTVTAGIVSQVQRDLTASGGYKIIDVIQLDAAINPGNSGGPLVNMFGEVVGINTAIVSGSTGVGFAIPSDTILRELPSLLATGRYAHPWLGISGTDMNVGLAVEMGVNSTSGVLISEVTSDGPADKAGLRGGSRTVIIDGTSYAVGGDIILELNGVTMRNFNDLSIYLERNTQPGQTISVTFLRGTQKLISQVILGTRPQP
ncbi:MAG: trypsin-like peptidase domain-containing protein [Candidatus Bathyarchaeota archaeon]